MDANFRLTNRIIVGEHEDPEMGPGWAYNVNPGPYKDHVKKYVSETDVCVEAKPVLSSRTDAYPDNDLHRVHGAASKGHKDDDRPAHVWGRRLHVRPSRGD